MGNNKAYLLGIALLAVLISFLIANSDGLRPLGNEMWWVLKQLPEVKSVEYLEALKKS